MIENAGCLIARLRSGVSTGTQMPAKRVSPRSRSSRRERNFGLRQDWKPLLVREEHLRDLPSKPETADVKFNLRDYRAADFERLWQIDQLCFPQGISYTQMDLSGFITRRNAITLVADFDERHDEREKLAISALHAGDGVNSCVPGAVLSETAATTQAIAGFIIAHPTRGKAGRILTLDI